MMGTCSRRWALSVGLSPGADCCATICANVPRTFFRHGTAAASLGCDADRSRYHRTGPQHGLRVLALAQQVYQRLAELGFSVPAKRCDRAGAVWTVRRSHGRGRSAAQSWCAGNGGETPDGARRNRTHSAVPYGFAYRRAHRTAAGKLRRASAIPSSRSGTAKGCGRLRQTLVCKISAWRSEPLLGHRSGDDKLGSRGLRWRADFGRSHHANTLLTPSIVRYDSRGALTVGAKAAKFLDSDPKNTRAEFKRLMGTSTKLDFPAAKLAKLPEELSAEVLRSLRNDVKIGTGFCPIRP